MAAQSVAYTKPRSPITNKATYLEHSVRAALGNEDSPALTDSVKGIGIAPRLETATLGGGSYGHQVAKVAQELLGVDLMPWQLHALNGQLEHDAEGNLIRRRSLVSVKVQGYTELLFLTTYLLRQ